MSKFKGTPGPWTVVEHNWSDASVYGADDTRVCMFKIDEDSEGEDSGKDELLQRANAALIDQAPAMLEALQALIQCGAPMLAMDPETFPHLRGDWVRASETANSILAALRAAGAIE